MVNGAYQQLALTETYIDAFQYIRVNDSFPICPSFGVVWYTSVDLGFPDVRDSVQANPQRDGTLDQTQYTGARNVTIEGVVLNEAFDDDPELYGWPTDVQWNSASWWVSLLSAWASPARRYRFYFTDEIGRSRFVDVRGDSFTSSTNKISGGYREFQLNMVNPSGKIYQFLSGEGASPDGRNNVPIKLSAAPDAGRAYPEAGPYIRNYPPASIGLSAVHYEGSVPNGCLIQLYTGTSTMQAPRVTFTAPDGLTSTVGLTTMPSAIPARTTVYIDTVTRTITSKADNSSP
jgi:hypothetical protein